jgi:hypothetical protein
MRGHLNVFYKRIGTVAPAQKFVFDIESIVIKLLFGNGLMITFQIPSEDIRAAVGISENGGTPYGEYLEYSFYFSHTNDECYWNIYKKGELINESIPEYGTGNGTLTGKHYPTNIYKIIYNGYTINIIKEEVVDANITLLRRRVVVADQRGVIEYEGTPTYAPDDQVLLKEGQYYIDKQKQIRTSDEGNDSATDQEIIDIVTETGLNPDDTLVGNVKPD